MKFFAKTILVLALLCVASFAQYASSGKRDFLTTNQVDLNSVMNLVDRQYETYIENGEVRVSNGQWFLHIQVDSDRNFIKLHASFEAISTVSDARGAKLANKFSNDKILVKAYYHHRDIGDVVFDLDHSILYDGGLSGKNLNSAISWFFKIFTEYNTFLKEEDAIS